MAYRITYHIEDIIRTNTPYYEDEVEYFENILHDNMKINNSMMGNYLFGIYEDAENFIARKLCKIKHHYSIMSESENIPIDFELVPLEVNKIMVRYLNRDPKIISLFENALSKEFIFSKENGG